MNKPTSVEEYIKEHEHFREALIVLRSIITSTELEEHIKWNAPVYALNGKNVIGLSAFKHHFGIWFFNGVFLRDKHNILVKGQEKTKGLRQMRFESIEDIDENVVFAYVREAIQNQKLGKIIKTVKLKTIVIPDTLKQILNKDKQLQDSFNALSLYKQKDYCEYIAAAKREVTVETRLKKITPMILDGIGLNDKYKN